MTPEYIKICAMKAKKHFILSYTIAHYMPFALFKRQDIE
jgi:hypothetical protein